MSIKFMLDNHSVDVIDYDEDRAVDVLPPAVYSIQNSMMRGFYLNLISPDFDLPPILFGELEARINKCLTAFKDRSDSTGILLTGDKGTGKTLFMSVLANTAIHTLSLPVIMVRDAYSGAGFESIMKKIGPAVVLFDEFAKHYNKTEQQPQLLSYFDGIDKTKRLNIITENSIFDINEFLIDRPGRALYHFKYRKLDEESVVAYCASQSYPSERVTELIDIVRRTRLFTFDMLQNIVTETMRTGDTIREALKEMNIRINIQPSYMRLEEVRFVDPTHDAAYHGELPKYEPDPRGNVFIVPEDEGCDSIELHFRSPRTKQEKKARKVLSEAAAEVAQGNRLMEANTEVALDSEQPEPAVSYRRHDLWVEVSDMIFNDENIAVYQVGKFTLKFSLKAKAPHFMAF